MQPEKKSLKVQRNMKLAILLHSTPLTACLIIKANTWGNGCLVIYFFQMSLKVSVLVGKMESEVPDLE